MTRLRQVAKKLLGGLGTTVLCLLALEGVCRLLEPTPPWKIHLPPKPPGTYRILVLGGSTAAGLPVPELGFVAQLEAGLRSLVPDRPLEVVNLGRGGAGSDYVLKALEGVIDADGDLIIIVSAHNEFLMRASEDAAARNPVAGALRRHSATARILDRWGRNLGAAWQDAEQVMPQRLVPFDRQSPWFREKIASYRLNLEAIVRLARSRKVPLLMCTAPWNVADWPPVHRRISWAVANPTYDADIEHLKDLIKEGELAEAETKTGQLLERYGEDAMVLYLKGSIYRRSGRGSQAGALFVRAKDLDPYPLRVLSRFNMRLRSLAGHQGVGVVDVERAFERRAEDGLVGSRLIADNVHPTPLGGALMARAIVREMAREGHFVAEDADLGAAEVWLPAFLNAMDETERDHLLLKRLLKNGTYSMKTPFFNFAASRRCLEEALELDAKNWRVRANLGTLALLENRIDEGREQLRRATTLKGSPLDPHDRRATPCLKEAAAKAGIRLDSLTSPR